MVYNQCNNLVAIISLDLCCEIQEDIQYKPNNL